MTEKADMEASTIMACTAKIRPFPGPTEITCERGQESHDEHGATLRDYAFPGSETALTWLDDDRRTYRGEWAPCDAHTPYLGQCILPRGHRGNCAR